MLAVVDNVPGRVGFGVRSIRTLTLKCAAGVTAEGFL